MKRSSNSQYEQGARKKIECGTSLRSPTKSSAAFSGLDALADVVQGDMLKIMGNKDVLIDSRIATQDTYRPIERETGVGAGTGTGIKFSADYENESPREVASLDEVDHTNMKQFYDMLTLRFSEDSNETRMFINVIQVSSSFLHIKYYLRKFYIALFNYDKTEVLRKPNRSK